MKKNGIGLQKGKVGKTKLEIKTLVVNKCNASMRTDKKLKENVQKLAEVTE